MAGPILQQRLRFAPWMQAESRRLPGIMPLAPADWLQVDEAYSAQLALKAGLLETRRDEVHALSQGARPAAGELLARVLIALKTLPGFTCGDGRVRRPDGEWVTIDHDEPLVTLSRLVQEDLVIMEKRGAEHVLTAALLCFPASWTLAQKFMKPLTVIHTPVAPYDADVARRVQRLFDAIHADRPLWRANALFYEDPALYQPRREEAPRQRAKGRAPFVRSERQSLLRLPETGAVVFSIHTTLVRRDALTPEQVAGLARHPIEEVPA